MDRYKELLAFSELRLKGNFEAASKKKPTIDTSQKKNRIPGQ